MLSGLIASLGPWAAGHIVTLFASRAARAYQEHRSQQVRAMKAAWLAEATGKPRPGITRPESLQRGK